MFHQIDTLFVRNRTTVLRRRAASNSQWGVLCLGGGGASSRRRPMGGLGQSPQPPEARGPGGGAPALKNFAFFLQK